MKIKKRVLVIAKNKNKERVKFGGTWLGSTTSKCVILNEILSYDIQLILVKVLYGFDLYYFSMYKPEITNTFQ